MKPSEPNSYNPTGNVHVTERWPTLREHVIEGGECWCRPVVTYTDPITGAKVISHNDLKPEQLT